MVYYTICQRLCSALVKNVGSEASLGSNQRANFLALLLTNSVTRSKLFYVSVHQLPQPWNELWNIKHPEQGLQ